MVDEIPEGSRVWLKNAKDQLFLPPAMTNAEARVSAGTEGAYLRASGVWHWLEFTISGGRKAQTPVLRDDFDTEDDLGLPFHAVRVWGQAVEGLTPAGGTSGKDQPVPVAYRVRAAVMAGLAKSGSRFGMAAEAVIPHLTDADWWHIAQAMAEAGLLREDPRE